MFGSSLLIECTDSMVLLKFCYKVCFFLSSTIGETPLHKAAETTSVAMVKLLLDEGADINPKTGAKVQKDWLKKHCTCRWLLTVHDQRTPLAKACQFGRLQVVNLLLERGAKMSSEALEDALKEGYEYVMCCINVNWINFCSCMPCLYESIIPGAHA